MQEMENLLSFKVWIELFCRWIVSWIFSQCHWFRLIKYIFIPNGQDPADKNPWSQCYYDNNRKSLDSLTYIHKYIPGAPGHSWQDIYFVKTENDSHLLFLMLHNNNKLCLRWECKKQHIVVPLLCWNVAMRIIIFAGSNKAVVTLWDILVCTTAEQLCINAIIK